MIPARGLVIVRPIETPERIAHSRIILTERTREALTTHQMEVVAVGAPSICEDEDCERIHGYNPNRGGDNFGVGPSWSHAQARAQGAARLIDAGPTTGERPWTVYCHPCDVKPGDWVLVRHRSLTETHEDNLFAVAQDDILARIEAK